MIKKVTVMAGAIALVAALGTATPATAGNNQTAAEFHGTQLAMAGGTIIKRRTILRCIATGLKKIKKGKGNAKKNAALVLKNAAMLSNDLKKLFRRDHTKA